MLPRTKAIHDKWKKYGYPPVEPSKMTPQQEEAAWRLRTKEGYEQVSPRTKQMARMMKD